MTTVVICVQFMSFQMGFGKNEHIMYDGSAFQLS